AQGRAVDGADHGHFDIQQIQEEMLPFPIGLVPRTRRAAQFAVRSGAWPRKRLTRPGHDHDFIVRIAPDIPKRLGEFTVREFSPLQWSTIGMKSNLQNTIAPFHADALVRLGILVKPCHTVLPLALKLPRSISEMVTVL